MVIVMRFTLSGVAIVTAAEGEPGADAPPLGARRG